MDVLKCMTVDRVLKELTMYALAYNLVRGDDVPGGGPSGVSKRIGSASSTCSRVVAPRCRGGGGDAGAGGDRLGVRGGTSRG